MADEFKFFNNVASGYYLPHIRYVTEIRKTVSSGTVTGCCFVFKVYFSYNLDIELAFDNYEASCAQRRELIGHMMDYWGLDHVIFSNGFDSDVTVVAAIDELPDVVEKDSRAGFAIMVAGVPDPLYFVFPELQAAQACLEALRRKLENHRRQKALQRIAVGA
jgi:hypothetical protein